ncbi:MAG: YciI family protein [Candidatus Wenzhouxiangella sp. M2_3B_020]
MTNPIIRLLLPLACSLVVTAVSFAEEPKEAADYDAELAAELGADDYGMRRYVMAFLKTGPTPPEDPERARELQAAHMANIRRMAEEGQLVLAGPFMDDTEIRGIYLFATDDLHQASEWTATDPAVKAGSLVMELHPWYGSAAVMKVLEIHPTIAKKSF